MHRNDMPLRPMMGAGAFAKWGIDFVGPIDLLAMHTHAQHIITAMNYVTKWVEIKANKKRMTPTLLISFCFSTYSQGMAYQLKLLEIDVNTS